MAKYKVGFTVGTFDMFHVGHLNLFRQAKEYCDYLIVAIHTDEWVMHCKNRPTIISYDDRAAIVGACRYVDKVVPNATRCKMEAWKKYHFDVAFIGDDWKGKFDFLEEEGCEVVYLPRTPEISSTKIKTELNKK